MKDRNPVKLSKSQQNWEYTIIRTRTWCKVPQNKNTTAECEFIVLQNRRAAIIQSANNTSNEIENSTNSRINQISPLSIVFSLYFHRTVLYLPETHCRPRHVNCLGTRARAHDWWLITYPHIQQKSLLWWRNSLSIRISSFSDSVG